MSCLVKLFKTNNTPEQEYRGARKVCIAAAIPAALLAIASLVLALKGINFPGTNHFGTEFLSGGMGFVAVGGFVGSVCFTIALRKEKERQEKWVMVFGKSKLAPQNRNYIDQMLKRLGIKDDNGNPTNKFLRDISIEEVRAAVASLSDDGIIQITE